MTAVTYKTARENLAKLIAKVWDDRAPVIIATDDNKPVVLVALDDYDLRLEESADAHLRRSPENMRRINDGIEQLKAGKVVVKTMEELEALERGA